MNGTTFSRPQEKSKTEQELANEIAEKTKKYSSILMLMSTTNIDRVTTMQKVANKNNKKVIHDLLLSNVLQLVTQKIPNALNSNKINVYTPSYLYWLRNKPEYRPYIKPFEHKTKLTGRILKEGNFIMNIRVSMLRDIIKLKTKNKCLDNCCVVYGMWLGYKEEDIYKEFFNKMKELDIDIIDLHVSGHADYTAFKQLFDITKPDIVIPIHTEDKYKITQYTDKAVILNDMETLEINEKGEYKIIMNEYLEIEQGKLNLHNIEDKPHESTTNQEVIERLKDKKLEEYTREDTLDRYIAYGTEEELKEPKIQQLLIKHKLYNELIDFADIIEDKQVIQDLLSSELFNDKSIYLIEGKILNIEKRILTEETNGNNIYYSMVTLEDKHTLKPIELKAQVLLDLEALEDYKKELKPYYNTNIVALVGNTNQELCIRCYLKYYDDIDYDRYCKS